MCRSSFKLHLPLHDGHTLGPYAHRLPGGQDVVVCPPRSDMNIQCGDPAMLLSDVIFEKSDFDFLYCVDFSIFDSAVHGDSNSVSPS